ncbi:MAG: hypothetical protein A2Y38_25400 [Spirochaetes bacterium GWB1_59_5]|nr:MAG: hypothetical protein A2Y38_25400 [Spirochaetes bacterium GWB1_59_5]
MKRTLIISVVMLSLAATGFAQSGDARARGLAGALTAVGDDMNALFYNPAGLAFLRTGYLNVEGNAALTANRSFDEPFSNALRDIYAVAGAGNVPTYYYTYAEGEDPFDEFVFGVDDIPYLAELTALAQANGETDYANLIPGRQRMYYQQLVYRNDSYNAINSVTGNPRVTIGGPHWGVSGYADYVLTPSNIPGTNNANTVLDYTVFRQMGVTAGLGLDLGPIAVGANVRYVQDAIYDASFRFEGGEQDSADILELLSHQAENADASFTVGLGALFTVGMANLAVYNDNVMPFLDQDNNTPFLDAFLDTMTFGLAFMPSDNKFESKKSLLVFMSTADFKNVGDAVNRQLCAGLEAGINLDDFIVGLVRAGYTQRLPGEFSELANAFNIDNGTVSLGASVKLWVLKLDASYSIPVGYIGNNWDMTDEQRRMDSMKLGLSVALTF